MNDDATEKQNMPGQLLKRESNTDGFVTEQVIPMSKLWSRVIAIWFISIGIISAYILATVIPLVSNSTMIENRLSRIDSLRKIHSRELRDSLKTKSDTIKRKNAILWLNDSLSINPMVYRTRQSYSVPAYSWLRSIGFTMLPQVVYFLIFWAGALGGCIHGLTSLADYRGERRLFRSWVQWYLIKPILGGFVAFVFIFILQTGLLSGSDGAKIDSTNIMGMCAIGILAGLATETATDRFRDIFKAAFGNNTVKSDSLKKNEPHEQ